MRYALSVCFGKLAIREVVDQWRSNRSKKKTRTQINYSLNLINPASTGGSNRITRVRAS